MPQGRPPGGSLATPSSTGQGAWVPTSKARHNSALAAHVGVDHGPDGGTCPEGTMWRMGDLVFRVCRLRRREAVRADLEWAVVIDRMRELAATHGDDGVRLVVWFDS